MVVGTLDPNPKMSGASIALLRERGLDVTLGVLEKECRNLNRAYNKWIATGLPLVTLKWAQTLDGLIATSSGSSRWISSEASRRYAHCLRTRHDAVLVGAGTVAADNPELTVRHVRGRNPLRVVLDSALSSDASSLMYTVGKAETLVFTTKKAVPERLNVFRTTGSEVIALAGDDAEGVPLRPVLEVLGGRGIASVLVEGGAAVITSFLRERLADRAAIFVAPRIMGEGLRAVGDLGVTGTEKMLRLSGIKTGRFEGDILFEAEIEYP